MKYLLCLLLFASCITQKKVNTWLDKNPAQAAQYCADHFPPDTTDKYTKSAPDSTGYKEVNNQLTNYTDSLFKRLDSLRKIRRQWEVVPNGAPQIDLDSLRREVDAEIKRRTKPCIDSIQHVYHTVVDRARERALQGKLDSVIALKDKLVNSKDETINARDKTITEQAAKIKAKNKWVWAFWILVAFCALYVGLKVRKLIPFVLILCYASCIDNVEVQPDPDAGGWPAVDTIQIIPPTK